MPIELPVNSKKEGLPSTTKSSIGLIIEIIHCFFRVLGLAVSKFDSDTVFTSPNKSSLKMTGARKTLFFPTAKLDFLKALKNKANVTINDVLLAATTGAFRRYCEYRKDPLVGKGEKTVNRALIPVAFPRSEKMLANPAAALQNKWAFVSTELPIHKSTCNERLLECSKAMTALKTSPIGKTLIAHSILYALF